ncbi:MAG: L,D-transpeptidase family protein [Bacteroidales bacterium]
MKKCFKIKYFLGILVILVTFSCVRTNISIVPFSAHKLILVVTDGWDSTAANIYLLEKQDNKWNFNGKKYKGVIGRNGFGWGLGLHDSVDWEKRFPYRPKLEGDLRTPAGLYTLSDSVMGYDSILPVNTAKRYVQLHASMHAVDDTSSLYYNQIVDTNSFPSGFRNYYNSYEDLANMGPVYKYLFVIEHNKKRVRGRGSNIYFHIRNTNGKGTGGCTAVDEKDILEIIEWIDNSTVILQLPEKVYRKIHSEIGLPGI